MSTTFIDMSANECWERMTRGGVGRIAWCAHGRPQICPVNFTVVGGDIVFRTAPYTDLGTQVPGSAVVFEMDEIDHHARSGWSVVVRGEAAAVEDPDEIMQLRRTGPEPWAGGQRQLVIRLRPLSVTGRSVGGDAA